MARTNTSMMIGHKNTKGGRRQASPNWKHRYEIVVQENVMLKQDLAYVTKIAEERQARIRSLCAERDSINAALDNVHKTLESARMGLSEERRETEHLRARVNSLSAELYDAAELPALKHRAEQLTQKNRQLEQDKLQLLLNQEQFLLNLLNDSATIKVYRKSALHSTQAMITAAQAEDLSKTELSLAGS